MELHRARLGGAGTADTVASIASDGESLLTVARQRGELEVHELSQSSGAPWRLRARIPGRRNAHTTAVAFASGALVTAGLDGTLLCWDLLSARPESALDSLGGATWALAPSRDGAFLAAACDDGCLRLFAVTPSSYSTNELSFHLCFPRATCRQLCACWVADPLTSSDNATLLLSGGSDGSVRLYDPLTKRERRRVVVSDSSDDCVWCVTPVGTIGRIQSSADAPSTVLVACGDSSGRLSLVDLSTGTVEHAERQHSADILAVQSLNDSSRVFTGGADGMVAAYDRAERTERSILSRGDEVHTSRWSFSVCKRPHSHDVHALCCFQTPLQGSKSKRCAESMLSGGVDGHVLWYDAREFLSLHPKEVAFQDRACVATRCAPSQPLVATPRQKEVHLYSLATAGTNDKETSSDMHDMKGLKAAQAASHPASLRLSTKHFIWSCTLAPDGTFIAVSDCFEARVFSLDGKDRPHDLRFRAPAARRLHASNELIAAVEASTDAVQCYSAESGEKICHLDDHCTTWQHGHSGGPTLRLPSVKDVIVSSDSALVCVLTFNQGNTAFVYSTKKGGQLRGTLPSPRRWKDGQGYAFPCAAAFSPSSDEILVATSDNQVHLYDARECKLSKWSESNKSKLPQRLLQMPGCIHHVSFDPAADATVGGKGRKKSNTAGGSKRACIATPSAFCCFDLHRGVEEEWTLQKEGDQQEQKEKKRKRGPSPPPALQASKAGQNFRVVPLERRCIHMSYVGKGRALLLEHSHEDTAREKPPPVFRKRYGA